MGSKGGDGKSGAKGGSGRGPEGARLRTPEKESKKRKAVGKGKGITRGEFFGMMGAAATVLSIAALTMGKSAITWNDARLARSLTREKHDRLLDGAVLAEEKYSLDLLNAAQRRLMEIMSEDDFNARWDVAAGTFTEHYRQSKLLGIDVVTKGIPVRTDEELGESVSFQHVSIYENDAQDGSGQIVLGKQKGFQIIGIGVGPKLLVDDQGQPSPDPAVVSARIINNIHKLSAYTWLESDEILMDEIESVYGDDFFSKVQIIRMLGNVYGDIRNASYNPGDAQSYCGMSAKVVDGILQTEELIRDGNRFRELMQTDLFWDAVDNYCNNIPDESGTTRENYSTIKNKFRQTP
jgi:hypothetical protein